MLLFSCTYVELIDKKKLISDYRKSDQRLILLDYDGTLISFFERPEDAEPDEGVLQLLERISSDMKNEVVLISGRDKNTLEKWFGVNAGYAAEHGAQIKEKGGEWRTMGSLRNDWKRKIRPILELYVDRTPGSFIEEKEFSLVWHYRKADPELGQVMAAELIDNLAVKTPSNLQVLEGNKVVEIKNSGVNKGRVASHWLAKKNWDFVLAIGDDVTDEDIFSALPKTAYSIKVGTGASIARFRLDSPSSVLSLLKELVGD